MVSHKQEVKEYYDKKSANYDDYSKRLWSKVYDAVTWNLTKPYVPSNSESLVFDAAGGTGKWSIPIAKCGPKVILGDVSKGMLGVAKDKINREGLQQRIKIKECDLLKLDFEDETFDLVFCEHALCFIKEQEKAIRELVRVLKKGCPLIIGGQNRYVLSLLTLKTENANYAYEVLSKQTQFIMHNRLRVYGLSPDEFRRLLEKAGIRVEKLVGKLFTMPLAVSSKKMSSERYSDEFYRQLLNIELELSSRSDSIALAGHFQAVGYKQ
jgi:ubiquinone/menaquinone biosynthesis C-methylase UbiE